MTLVVHSRAEILVVYESRCKVCNSPNRKVYEEYYTKTIPRPTWFDMQEKAKVLGEDISYKAFERHFKRHLVAGVVDYLKEEEETTQAVEEARREAIDIVQEIKNNLNLVKTLLTTSLAAYQKSSPISPAELRSLTELLREHRQTLETCERLESKLEAKTTLTETELLRILVNFAKNLCPQCREAFKTAFDDYLRKKQIVA